MVSPLTPERLAAEGIGTFFRPRDLELLGFPFSELQRLVASGVVQKIETGLYRLTATEPNEFETLAMVVSAAPNMIICLISALSFHGIGTQVPHEVWLALDRKARKPAHLPAKARIVRFSGAMLTYGVETREILGVTARVTSPPRTVVDCFRYRSKIGLDVALEALRDALGSRAVTVDQIARTAEVCRAGTVMRPYLEAITR
ncbi:MAG: type IV toxin-antitoxin system AbiEi family antitoxin domain-containing protein [Caulobacteraceae bacterium]